MAEREQAVSGFEGLRKRGRGTASTFFNMENMSLRNYPLLCSRKRRGYLQLSAPAPGRILGAVVRTVRLSGALREALCLISASRLTYLWQEAGQLHEEHFACSLTDREKQAVIMGAWLVLWPDKVRIHMGTPGTVEPLEQRVSLGDGEITLACHLPGVGWRYASYLSAEAPASAAEGQLWGDISAVPIRISRWSEEQGVWLEVSGEYRLALTAPAGTFRGFSAGDYVSLNGFTGISAEQLRYRFTTSRRVSEKETEAVRSLEGFHRIESMDEETFTFLSFAVNIPTVYSLTPQPGQELTVTRAVPDMDFICECGNRLWGCRYGEDEAGSLLNELYCSKLGDCRNWYTYAGLSTDSWTASCGTDGPWTGCINLQGYPLFFKERSVTKIYPSAIGAHRTVVMQGAGVQQGSHNSLVLSGDTAYYLGTDGVYAFDGSAPLLLSAALGETRLYRGSAGLAGSTLYLSATDGSGAPQLYTCDIGLGLWCREDNTDVLRFALLSGLLFALCRNGTLFCTDGKALETAEPLLLGESEGGVTLSGEAAPPWLLETAPIWAERDLPASAAPEGCRGYGFRLRATPGQTINLLISYDGGPWHEQRRLKEALPGIYTWPGTPCRCGSFRLRLSGVGDVEMITAAMRIAAESEGTK